MKRIVSLTLCLLLFAALLPVGAFADSGNLPTFLEDTAHEMLFDPNPRQTPQLLMSPVDSPLTDKTLSCDSFITTETQKTYINRMIPWYLAEYPALQETLDEGYSVVMFFEGGSDNTQSPSYDDINYRDGALGLVLRRENGETYIADYCENCTTLPDFPLNAAYDNGHTGYGTATLMDGVYKISNVNHRGYYFAMSATKAPGYSNIPCLYMCNDGTFARLNGTGINVHARMRDRVSDDPMAPVSAGCLTVGDSSSLDEYNRFMQAFNYNTKATETRFSVTPTDFNGADTFKFTVNNFQSYGMLVVDRYLAREKMLQIYQNQAAVDAITLCSCLAQQDPAHILSGFKEYPSYLQLTLSAPATITSLPTAAATELSSVTCATATSLYATGTDLWYRVQTDSGVGFLPANAVASATTLYDDISAHNFNYPTEKLQFKSFSVRGILGSVYNRFASVTGSIFSASNPNECTYTAPVDAYTYSINASDYGYSDANPYNMDNALAFSGLAVGEHRYQVKATVRNYYAEDGEVKYEDKVISFVDEPFTVIPLAVLPEGTNTQWLQGSATGLAVRTNVDALWVNGVSVDGAAVPDTGYSKTEGADTVVTLTPAYLQTLPNGQHTLKIETTKGVTLQSEFTVSSPANPPHRGGPSAEPVVVSPATADNGHIALWLLCVSVSLTGAAFLLRKKHISR